MPGCIVLHTQLEETTTTVDIDLLNIGCNRSITHAPEAQAALTEQLKTGRLDLMLQDDTGVTGAQLVLNGSPLAVSCGGNSGAPEPGGGVVINAVDNDPANLLWNCDTNRAPFGDKNTNVSRCFTFTYTVPPEGIKSAIVQVQVFDLKDPERWTDAVVAAVGAIGSTPTSGTSLVPEVVIISDDFNRPDADRCDLGAANSALGGDRQLYYLPIFPSGPTDPSPLGANLVSGALQNNTLDYGGFQFALAPPCASARGTVRGADMGQDLNIRAELLVPTNAQAHISQAGPYVRSRAAAVADGIIGGASAGYWVQLESTGEVKVKRLNPPAVIAVSGTPASFDPAAPHQLEIAAGGERLQVALDGKLQTFKQDEQLVTDLKIPPTAGTNDGTAGIAFGAEPNRGQIGGQRADNVVVSAYRPLDGLPIQNNFASPSDQPAAPAPATAAPATAALAPTDPSSSSAAPVASAAAPDLSRADCDGDSALSEVDALCALDMSVQLKPVSLGMDVDGNGSVDSRDAAIILQHVVGK
jgi:hypothetical protein